jgi:hypothetical protein
MRELEDSLAVKPLFLAQRVNLQRLALYLMRFSIRMRFLMALRLVELFSLVLWGLMVFL